MIDIKNIYKFHFKRGDYYISDYYIIGKCRIEIDMKKRLGIYFFDGSFYQNKITWRISKSHFSNFIEELKTLGVFSWTNNYSNKHVCDGGYWSLSIKSKNNEIFEVMGDNDYPEKYNIFYDTLEKYFPVIHLDREYREKLYDELSSNE